MRPKIGDTVQFKKSGITGTVEKILRGTYVVKTPTSKLSAWPEDLIIVGHSEVSLEKEMDEHQKNVDEIMAIQGIEPIEAEIEEVWHCPEGYIFKDENGNVINATKIVLEKKKKEYPKTYEECCKVLNTDDDSIIDISVPLHYNHLLISFTQLLICRDAYWKIAGEEMGFGKPWELSIGTPIYYIYYNRTVGTIKNDYADDIQGNIILAFPTKEMRDAFYENFKSEIEQCKELL